MIELSVTDDGVGMDESTLALMRERLDHPMQAPAEAAGSGYGLSNVQARLKLTYGASDCGISIDSEPNVGTTVKLKFPIHEEGE